MARVFLSSTPPDVVEYRHAANAVLQRLGHQVVGLVAFQTEAQSSIQTRPADVSDADLVEGTRRSSLDELTKWTCQADKVIAF